MEDDYKAFLKSKMVQAEPVGLDTLPDLHGSLMPHQKDGVEFALVQGRAALFYDTGLGKTRMQLEWARVICEVMGGTALVLAPIAVAAQTIREGAVMGVSVKRCYDQSDVVSGAINITNYDRLDKFDTRAFTAVVLDESSILKNFTGKIKRTLCEKFANTRFRLCCTATPAPNDYMEMGNHSEFLSVMPGTEMLSRWFANDTMNMGKYVLKGHATTDFWDWVSSWARCVSKPSDLGYSDHGFALPPLRTNRHIIKTDLTIDSGDMLFRMPVMSATELHKEKRLSAPARAATVADIVTSEPDQPWLVWCDTDYEADALKAVLPDAVEVRGSMTAAKKEQLLEAFSAGQSRVMITKPSVAGFGLNWQHCARLVFVGVSYSYEMYYQAIRRCWRFGQTREVQCHVVMAETESTVWSTVVRKQGAHDVMKSSMFQATKRAQAKSRNIKIGYNPTHQGRLPLWLKAS